MNTYAQKFHFIIPLFLSGFRCVFLFASLFMLLPTASIGTLWAQNQITPPATTTAGPTEPAGAATPSGVPTAASATAAATAPALQNYTLDNGLELILAPQQNAQRISIGIAFKGGTDIQTNKTAGLFRLLEQLSFRGKAGAPGEPEPAAALDAAGAEAISGGIMQDGFMFSFLVKPDQLQQGIDTLSYLFSDIRLDTAFSDPAALAEAKQSCIEATTALKDNPEAIYSHALNKKLFSSAAWRLDAEGPNATVEQASQASIKALIGQWFIPNNAALIICGAFSPDEAKTLVETACSGWQKAANPLKTAPKAFPKPGVARPAFMVYPDPSMSSGTATIELRYRGPDVASGKAETAILWAELASSQGGRLASAIVKGLPKSCAPSDITVRYEPSRSASYFSISTKIAVDSKTNVADCAMTFKELVRGSEAYALKTNASYYSAKDYSRAAETLANRRAAQLSEPASAGLLIGKSWISGGYSWFAQLPEKIGNLSARNIQSFADEYFMKNLEIVAVRLSPSAYEKLKKTFTSYGFEPITAAKAFWWQ